MIQSEKDMKKWKNEQIRYYQNYLNNFERDSREYRVLEKGITDLKKSL
ncbi:MAG: hypothetical protein JW982_05200 [Spirochaetes bacterium]|nr:hypothetical protein [Spirochaetota bacterium]